MMAFAQGDPVLITENLSKVYRRWGNRRTAVDNLNLTVRAGEVLGFLGPNGAGKSTTLRMILGLIHPTAGRVAIGGHDLATDRLRALRHVGAFVDAPAFYPYLTGLKNLQIFAGLSGGATQGEIDTVLRRVGLSGREREPVSVYSHGMRQRLGIAACLLPRPSLIVLDEPNDGLDPHGILATRVLLQTLAKEDGLAILLSSHLLSEVEKLCDRLLLLHKGQTLLEGTLDALQLKHRRLILRTPAATAIELLSRKRIAEARPLPDGSMMLPPGTDPAAVAAALAAGGIELQSLALETDWLERIYVERTHGDSENAA